MAHSGFFLALEAAGTGAHPASWRRAGSRAEDLFTGRHRTSIRELIIGVTARQQFVGTPAAIAERIDAYVQSDAADSSILVPHLTPYGLDESVDRVVPERQERGSFRTEYAGTTLRDLLGPRHPHRRTTAREGAEAS